MIKIFLKLAVSFAYLERGSHDSYGVERRVTTLDAQLIWKDAGIFFSSYWL